MKRKPEDIEIRQGDYNNLWIHQDWNDEVVGEEVCASLTLTPSSKKFEHHHVQLSIEQVKILKVWLDEFLEIYAK